MSYRGKKGIRNVLDSTPSARIREIKRFGRGLSDTTNSLFFGDNLQVLKSLFERKDIKGCVRLVYIDPPYSSRQEFKAGPSRTSTVSPAKKDQVAYEDLLVGAEYLEFLRRRLIMLRELLADDGSIYVHIDWKMGHYVKVVMDEVFGQKHFINDIARIKCNPKNFERKGYGNVKDTILFYSKTDNYVWNGSFEPYTRRQIERLFQKIDEEGRRYTTNPLHAPGETRNGPTGRPWRGVMPPPGRHWRYPPDVLEQLDRQGLIEWSASRNPRKRIYADEHMKQRKLRQDIWEFKDPPYPSYPTEKNLKMVEALVETSSNRGDIVLDCFAGSGTTLVAAELVRRQWIGVDTSPIAIETTVRRLHSLSGLRPYVLYSCTPDPLPDAIKKLL